MVGFNLGAIEQCVMWDYLLNSDLKLINVTTACSRPKLNSKVIFNDKLGMVMLKCGN